MDPFDFSFGNMWNNNVAFNQGDAWQGIEPINVAAAADIAPSMPYNPVLGTAAINNPTAVAELAANNGISPDAIVPVGQTEVGESVDPSRPTPSWGSRLAQATRGIQVPKPAEPPKVGTPAAPRPTGTVQGGQLLQLMQMLGAGQARGPTLNQQIGR